MVTIKEFLLSEKDANEKFKKDYFLAQFTFVQIFDNLCELENNEEGNKLLEDYYEKLLKYLLRMVKETQKLIPIEEQDEVIEIS